MKNYKWSIIFTIILIGISSLSINAQENNKITEINGKNSFDIGIKVSQIGWERGSDTVVILNEKSTIDGITAAPLANLYNAPVLLCSKDKISEEVSNEIKRLGPKNIIIIGGEDSISNKVELQLKNILPKIKLERIAGENRYDTCLLIAEKISEKVDIKRVYIGSGNGEADLISIASKAGHDKQPILLSQKDSIDEDIYKWMISNDLEDAYIIGGKNKISDKVVEDLNKITKADIRNNRVYGKDRFETNAMVIENFYTDRDIDNLVIVDANDVNSAFQMAPLSSKLDCPLFLAPQKSLSESQLKILDYSNIGHIYRLGNSVDNSVFKEITDILFYKKIDYSNKEVLFFIPHQDDEMLSFSNTIKKYLDSNSNVNIVLMANGSLSAARNTLNGEKNRVCKIHNYVHNPINEGYTLENNKIDYINKEDLTKYRNDELKRALIKLGVKDENIHFSKYIVDDKKITKEISINTIKEYMELYPNASVHAFYNGNYSKNNHVDHIAIGEGAKELYDKGIIKELYMHVEPYTYVDFVKTNQGGSLYKYYPWNTEQEESIVKSLKEYCIWEPKSGKLAVGYHSVKSYFDEAIKNPLNYIMVLR